MAVSRWPLRHGEWRAGAAADAMPGGAEPGAVLYTTLRTAGGRPLLAAAHQARLLTGCEALQWPPAPAAALWPARVGEAAGQAGSEVRARISLWLEAGALQGLLECSPLVLPGAVTLWAAPPGSVRKQALIKLQNPALLDLEAQAANCGAQEAMLRTADGVVTETSRSNLLWADAAGRIRHPRGPALSGVMLAWALAELRAGGWEINAVDASLQEVESAAELFVTSGVKGPVPAAVAAAGNPGKPAPAGCPVGKYLAEQYARLLARTAAGESG